MFKDVISSSAARQQRDVRHHCACNCGARRIEVVPYFSKITSFLHSGGISLLSTNPRNITDCAEGAFSPFSFSVPNISVYLALVFGGVSVRFIGCVHQLRRQLMLLVMFVRKKFLPCERMPPARWRAQGRLFFEISTYFGLLYHLTKFESEISHGWRVRGPQSWNHAFSRKCLKSVNT